MSARSVLAEVIKRYTIHWYAVTMLLYGASIPLTIFLFPATTLLLAVFVLFGGFTSSVAALASAIVTADEARKEGH